ncbi:NAD(P)/FAD-dependent oxidoreductase [Pedobacter agri]|uniref:Pyridine nucleotide-disulfide oxidoreductase domain-containing protein 2 n=1 Tax=Pedobacter agri TaxID=454586 RepID=A0A9X3DEF6_9SPHI|nr:NAD(P)/FAD-dependent oxidoreductase [Pedobacter agri]
MQKNYEYDAVVVGSGPNGLACAIQLQRSGLSVLLIEGSEQIGGGMRSKEFFPGYLSDVCSAIHPMAAGSPFFSQLPLTDYGLEYINPPVLAAHPFDNGTSASLKSSLYETANGLGIDKGDYLDLMQPIVENWPKLAEDILGPFKIPKELIASLQFGLSAMKSAKWLSNRFKTEEAKALFAGMAAHSFLPLDQLSTAAVGLVLMANGHLKGWPLPKGGSQAIANALLSYFESLGGKVQMGWMVRSYGEIPPAKAVIFDTGPKQLIEIAGDHLPSIYKKRLQKFRYGPGVFKIDWALSEPVPFTASDCRKAGTVHLGGTFNEIAATEKATFNGKIAENPFVLLAQQSLFDADRVPKGKQVLWGYCHVPNGSTVDMTNAVEQQIERFAPGFRDTIIDRHIINTAQFEAYNPNYIGGDINGGVLDLAQLYSRPILSVSPYRTPANGIYICSASTPPGGGVHGMCGFHAANAVLKDIK